mgnify:CR=1 FL=1
MNHRRSPVRLQRRALGTPPGSLTTSNVGTATRLHVITFDSRSFEETEHSLEPGGTLPHLPPAPDGGLRWINVIGVHDGELLGGIGREVGVDVLTLEDVQHTDQRPKMQPLGEDCFAVLRMVSWKETEGRLDHEQVSVFGRGTTVISFQERPGDVFDEIRERLRHGRGRIRSAGPDYLFYALLDALLDAAIFSVDRLEETLEDLEEQILRSAAATPLSRVHSLRGEVVTLRRAFWPLRESFQRASRGEYAFFQAETLPFLGDSHDNVLILTDQIDAQRERVTGLFQLHASMLSTSTNEVMRVLTIIATIFIPLTFLVGIYGMNFAHMPELQWRFGYPVLLGIMALLAAGMALYFKRRRWF